MGSPKETVCNASSTLVFPCSGAADVGEISDRAARRMTKSGHARMFCLAGIGGRVEDVLKAASQADTLLAIDGCSLDCATECLKQAGFESIRSVRITDLGMEKGQSPCTHDRIAAAVAASQEALRD